MKLIAEKNADNEWFQIVVECDCGKRMVVPMDDCLLVAPDGRRVCLRTDKIAIEGDENKENY